MTSNGVPPVGLIDASNILNRAYGVVSLHDKENVNADKVISMALSMLRRYLRELAIDPRYCMLVCEKGLTWRKAIYPEYKKDRKSKPEALIEVLGRGPEALRAATDLKLIQVDGYEADDVIATYAALLDYEFYTVTIISNDSDLLQCLTAQVSVGVPKQGGGIETRNPAWFKDKYGFMPDLLPDYKALCGEKGDNIVGVDQIGDKAARRLLINYGGIPKIYDLIDKGFTGSEHVTPRQVELLIAGREQAIRDLKLTTLVKDVPGVALKSK